MLVGLAIQPGSEFPLGVEGSHCRSPASLPPSMALWFSHSCRTAWPPVRGRQGTREKGVIQS